MLRGRPVERYPDALWREYTRGAVLSVALHIGLLLVLGMRIHPADVPSEPSQRVITVVQLQAARPSAPAPEPAASAPARPAPPQTAAQSVPTHRRRTIERGGAAGRPSPVPGRREPVQDPSPQPVAPPAGQDGAPDGDVAGEVVEIPWAYLWSVKRAIAEHRRYPRKAYAARQTGTSVIRIRLARDGRLLDATLLRTSGHALLDEEARDVILRIGHFAPLPERYIPGQAEFAIDQPIAFLLR